MSGKKHSQAFVDMVDARRAHVDELDVHQTRQRMSGNPDIVLIDVREDREFAIDACRGAIHIGKGVIERDIEKRFPDKDRPLVLYCGGGYRSVLAAHALQEMGYNKVSSMTGGIRAWRNAEYPLTQSVDQN